VAWSGLCARRTVGSREIACFALYLVGNAPVCHGRWLQHPVFLDGSLDGTAELLPFVLERVCLDVDPDGPRVCLQHGRYGRF
jgi:hypothetical protein